MKTQLQVISDFCAKQCESDPNGGRTEKLAVLEQLLEDIIEARGAENTVGVVFVDRRITALALYDYFRTRDKCIKAGDWIRVKDTKFNRLPPQDPKDLYSLEDIVRSRNKIVGFDVATRTFQNDNFDIEDIDNSLICDVIQGKHNIFWE